LKLRSLGEAKESFLNAFEGRGVNEEAVKVQNSLDRVTSRPVFARMSSPFYNSCAMDGIAVRSRDTTGATEVTPRHLKIEEDAIYVNTGEPLPSGFDAVIMIEDVYPSRPGCVEVRSPALPWQHVRIVGEDIVAGEIILKTGHRIRPQDIGAMLAAGVDEVYVKMRPRVSIIPVGSELIKASGRKPKVGEGIEYNSYVLSGMIEKWGGEAEVSEIVPDSKEEIRDALINATNAADLVLIIAGSSAGTKDYVPDVLGNVGSLFVHGVSIMPGKPVALGEVGGKPVIGVPGYPVSAMVVMDQFVRPLIRRMLSLPDLPTERVKAQVRQKIRSRIGFEEFLRVNLGLFENEDGSFFVAVPRQQRGSGNITSMVDACGILRIGRTCEGLEMGDEVEVELLKPLQEVNGNIIMIGSCDNAVSLLQNEVKEWYPFLHLISVPVGSMGGVTALKRGECHLCGMHLFDEKTGEYNIPFVKRYLGEFDTVLVNLTFREQGLIVPKGNPKKIKGIEDLARDDVCFINRQRGSGTRLLLDYKLKTLGIQSGEIRGYDCEVFTHNAVSYAVEAGIADCGLGIRAAADLFHLDFIPVFEERYDLCMFRRYFESDKFQKILNVIRSDRFKQKVVQLGGYKVSQTGRIMGVS
jgi:putative molybdopterin biosynthesis protein